MEYLMTLSYVLVGLLGLAVGSFLNVVIYRIPRHIFFSNASSYCPHCNTKLKWYELIPLFSWIFLGGKCRTCKENISFRYPFVELSNTVLWTLTYVFYGLQVQTFLYMIAGSLLLVVAFIDADTDSVPVGLSIALVVIGIAAAVCSVFFPNGILWWEHLVGGGAMLGVLCLAALITKGRGVDKRDGEVVLGVGLLIGWKMALFAMLFSAVALGVTILIRHKRADKAGEKNDVPLCPSIAIGASCAILLGRLILEFIF